MTLEEFFSLPLNTKLRSTINGQHYIKISPIKYQLVSKGLEEELTRVYDRALGCPDRKPPIYNITDEFPHHPEGTVFLEVIED